MDAGRGLSTRGHMADSWSRRGTPRWLWPVMPRGWSSAENGRVRLYHRSRAGGRRLTRRRASAKAWKRGGPGCADLRPHDQGISFREHPSKCQCRWACVESRQGWPCGDDPISRADDIVPVFCKNDISCWRGDVSPTDAAFLQNASIFAYADPGFHPGLVCAAPSGR